jgi:GTP-binding protein EngB required for normal cell division
MPKRNWKEWWPGIKSEVKDTSAWTGLGGVAAGAVGGAVATPVVGLLAAGAVISITLGRAVVVSFPALRTDPDDLIGMTFTSVAQIPPLSRLVPIVGVLGESGSGKSTLVETLKRESGSAEPTREIYATVMRSGGSTPSTFILLDGQGEDTGQQFSICDEVDAVFVFVDHTKEPTGAAIVADRRNEHEAYLGRMIPFIARRAGELKAVYVLLNKHDNWSRSQRADELALWGSEIEKRLVNDGKQKPVRVRAHSNLWAKDINKVWQEIEAIAL